MEKERYGSLDFLKVIATVTLVFHHYQQLLSVKFDNFINFYDGTYYLGVLVEFFFILSGFFMLPWIKRISDNAPGSDFRSFAFRRYRRILPMTALSVVVYELISYIIWRFFPAAVDGRTVLDLWGAATSAFCVQSGWCFPNPAINNPIWYISVLCLCYIVFYFVTYLSRRIGCTPVYGYLIVMLIGFSIKMCSGGLPFANEKVCRGYISFFEGVLLAMLLDSFDTEKKRYTILSLIILAVTAYAFRNRLTGDYYAVVGFLIYPEVIYLFLRKPVKKLFASKLWSTIGNIQFHAYLWHVPMLVILSLLKKLGLPFNTASVGNMFLFGAAVELFAVFSYFVLEKLADKLYMMILPKRKTAPERI